nr:hypothetical protein CFP56_16717 [Quercus suber]
MFATTHERGSMMAYRRCSPKSSAEIGGRTYVVCENDDQSRSSTDGTGGDDETSTVIEMSIISRVYLCRTHPMISLSRKAPFAATNDVWNSMCVVPVEKCAMSSCALHMLHATCSSAWGR